jgi:DNA repair exonuclease SbcCD nuclease subunit
MKSNKIAVIADTHFGVRNDSKPYLDYTTKSLREFFFPYLEKNGIKTVIHLGDLGDRRKYVNYQTAQILREEFLERLQSGGYDTHIMLGNHDVSFRNTNDTNTLTELLGDRYPNIKIYDKAVDVTVNGLPILFIPWICSDNSVHSINLINTSTSKVAMGHLEIIGFEMEKGVVCDHGFDKSVFDRYDLVYSGHFHGRSVSGSISYIGAFCEYRWSDYAGDRGFTVLDPETLESNFIKNPFRMHHSIVYNDSETDIAKFITDTDFSVYQASYVKLICVKKTNPIMYDLLVERINDASPADLVIIEEAQVYSLEDSEVIDESQDTQSIMNNYIDKLTFDINSDTLKRYMADIYSEALTIQERE